MVTGLIPPEVLSNLQTEVAASLDSQADWYPAGPPVGGHRSYPNTPTVLAARFVKRVDVFFTGQGQQSAVSTGFIYVPLGTPVGPLDKLIQHGADASKWPPILEISNRPTIGEPVLTRIRTGAA